MVVGSGKGVGEGIGVSVAVGTAVNVGCMGEGVNVGGASVGAGVVAEAHPVAVTDARINTRKTDPIMFFMLLSPFT